MKKKAQTSPLLAKMLSASAKQAPTTNQSATQITTSPNLAGLADAINQHQTGSLGEAAKGYQAVISQNLADTKTIARAKSLLGTVYLQQNQIADAEKWLKESVSGNPLDASTHNNLGVAYKQLGNKEAAFQHMKEAVRLDANYADALNNYGAALLEKREMQEAISHLSRAIALKPDYADSHYNLGTAYQSLKRFDEAEACFQRALAINPHFTSALFNSGLLRLLRGEFEQGWRLYEYRWLDEQAQKHVVKFSQPLWLGDADISGKTIFLYAEQGFGDFIQFCRYVFMVEKLGAKITLLVPEELFELAQSLSKNFNYIARQGSQTKLTGHCDFHCPLMSLPLAFKTELGTIPAQVPYLFVPSHAKEKWAKKLGTKSKFRIGLVWSGAAGHLNDVNRSLSLDALLPILRTDVEYHVLQKEIRPADAATLNQLKTQYQMETHFDELASFTDTAALIDEMDLVISVDTSVAHLAGALGKPLWLFTPFFPDFRWLLDRDDSPWYPTARLFRQLQMSDWSHPLANMKLALATLLNQSATAPQDHRALEIAPSNINNQRSLIDQALALHHANKLEEALKLYQQVLSDAPDNTETLTLLASLYLQQNKLDLSKGVFEKALALDDKNVLTLHNYALLLERLNQNNEAIAYLDAALKIHPKYDDAYKHKANVLKKIGKPDLAIETYQVAEKQSECSADFYFRFSNHLRDAERHQEALEAIDQAIMLNANFAQAYNNRGNILLDLKQADEAIKSYKKALSLKSPYANAHSNLGNAYLALNQFEEAISACDAALKIEPTLLAPLNNRANALQKLQRFDEAMAAYNQIIEVHKDYSFAPLNKGLLCLLLGNFAEGWPLYEWRWKNAPQLRLLNIFDKPLWLGKESLEGKSILLHVEQGYGDTIQFCRYAAMVAALGAKVTLVSTKLLYKLIHESFALNPATKDISVVSDGDVIPQFDFQCPLMSLPLALKTDINSIPAPIPYLYANQSLIHKWQSKLGEKKSKPRVGLVWSGSSAYTNDSNRSISLDALRTLFDLEIEFYCLQKEVKPEDETTFVATKMQCYEQDLTDFSETAALIHHMDLVISVDTSVAHLAGAIGKPLWVLLPYVPDFRWLLNRDDSPWYPSAKLFRQPKTGDWQAVIKAVAQSLQTHFKIDKKL